MVAPPETIRTTSRRIACDGSGGPNGVPPALGHPRSWLEIDARGWVDCGYCDRRFVLVGSPSDIRSDMPGDIESADEDSLGR